MDQLSPHHVPVYETREQQRVLWEECAERGQPVVAVRDARRGYIVRYDLQHLGAELAPDALAGLRRRTRENRSYPTASHRTGTDASAADSATTATTSDGGAVDPISESEGVGGVTGPVSGDLHAATESEARNLASRLSAIVFDRSRWQ